MSAEISSCTVEHEEFFRDESCCTGTADAIAFPTGESEVVQLIKQACERGLAITTQGARTGIVAGAVPERGLILNLSRMNAIGDVTVDEFGTAKVVVQPGALLSDVRNAISPRNLMFPPDPTETSASLGGMTACNASGAMSFFYGPTRNWVDSIRVVLADGDILAIRRGERMALGRSFVLRTECGRLINGTLPSYTMPNVKSAAGYYIADDMDMIDLFIGSEGTLGIITEIELKLIARPSAICGLTVFMPSEDSILSLVHIARAESSMRPAAIEFFNHDALDNLRNVKSSNPAFENIPALYIEFHADKVDLIEDAVMELIENATALGGSDEDTWFATTQREMESMKSFRHAIPEAVNIIIGERKRKCADITKLGTDMSVPNAQLAAAIAMYNADLSANGLESVIFGHIGDNHVHVNILPHNMDEYAIGKRLYMSWARNVVKMGGSVSAEHGIGKLKAPFLRTMYGDKGVDEMRYLKKLFDPDAALNPGVMFANS